MSNALPSANSRVTRVRSTLLLTSRAAVTSAGCFAAYEANLARDVRAELAAMAAGEWLAVELATAHYDACDALGFDAAKHAELGRMSGEKVRGTLLGTVSQVAKAVGTTPRTLVADYARFWKRVFDGGGSTYKERGPKDLEVDVFASPLLRSRYFREALAGTTESIFSHFSTRCFVRLVSVSSDATSATYLVQWA